MEVLGYLAAVAVGITLGLLGGGGAILAVPILVYLFEQSTDAATGYSLFIVAVTASVGAVSRYRQGSVHLGYAALFATFAFGGVIATRRFLLPALPTTLFQSGAILLERDRALLLFVAGLMMFTALALLRRSAEIEKETAGAPASTFEVTGKTRLLLVVAAMVVGSITGLVGAGGGFLIVPTLLFVAHLPLKRATGTSLLVIAANSLVGFLSDTRIRPHADWPFLLSITAAALVGMALGVRLTPRIPENRLRPAFGLFLLLMGSYMVGREFLMARPMHTETIQATSFKRSRIFLK
jgi:uncharacterized membrane protein YfcA